MPRATNILIIGFRLLTDVQIRAALLRNTLRPDSGEQGDAPLRTKKAVLSTPCKHNVDNTETGKLQLLSGRGKRADACRRVRTRAPFHRRTSRLHPVPH